MLSEIDTVSERRASTIATLIPSIRQLVNCKGRLPSILENAFEYGEGRRVGLAVASALDDALSTVYYPLREHPLITFHAKQGEKLFGWRDHPRDVFGRGVVVKGSDGGHDADEDQ